MFVNSYQARKLAALGLCTVLCSAAPAALAFADPESLDSAPSGASSSVPGSLNESPAAGAPSADANPAGGGSTSSPDASSVDSEESSPAPDTESGTPATHSSNEADSEDTSSAPSNEGAPAEGAQPRVEETESPAPAKDPNIPESIDIQGTSYTPTFTTLPKGSMSDFPDPYAKKQHPKDAQQYPNRYFIHYIDVFTGESLALDLKANPNLDFTDAWDAKTNTQYVAYGTKFEGNYPREIQRYSIRGYYQLNTPDFTKATPGGDPLDIYIYCVPLKSYVVDYIEESDPEHPIMTFELDGKNALPEFVIEPVRAPKRVSIPTQFEFKPITIPGFTIASGSENGVTGAFTDLQKSPEDVAPIRKTIVYKKIQDSLDASMTMDNVVQNGPVRLNRTFKIGALPGVSFGDTVDVTNLDGFSEGLQSLIDSGYTLVGVNNGPKVTYDLVNPPVVTFYFDTNKPVYIRSYAAQYRYGKLVRLEKLKEESLGKPNSSGRIPHGKWSVDLKDRETLTVENADGTTTTYKLAGHQGDTAGSFVTFPGYLDLLYTEVPTYKDSEAQTDPLAGEEKETQTDNPTTAENGSQTDNPSTSEAGSQTEQSSTAEGETQTDPTPSTSTGVQTEKPATSDAGVQADPDPKPAPGPEPKPAPDPEPAPIPEPKPVPVPKPDPVPTPDPEPAAGPVPVAEKVDDATQTEPVKKEQNAPKHAQAKDLPKTGDAQNLAGLAGFAAMLCAGLAAASKRFRKE